MRDRACEALPFDRRVVPEKVVRRRPDAVEFNVVEPRAQRLGLPADIVLGETLDRIHRRGYSLLASCSPRAARPAGQPSATRAPCASSRSAASLSRPMAERYP